VSKIDLLRVRGFRCFEFLEYKPASGLNFITGKNAAGKTSVLEAVCVLLRLRSPRTLNLGEMVRFGETAFSLEGVVLETRLSLSCTPPLRLLKLDGVAQSTTSDYLSIARIVWFGSEDLNLVSGSAERRRKLLDSAGLQLKGNYGRDLKIYDRSLRSRNLLLREERPDREVAAYNIPLAESGDRIIAARRELVSALSPLAAEACRSISGETLELRYQPGAVAPMLEALHASRDEELRLRQTRVGPQRDEVEIRLNGLPAAVFASEGQRRTVAVAMKLALAALIRQEGDPPLLLLDDIFGELDPLRRDALLRGIPEGSQAILSTADLSGITLPSDSCVHRLEQGIFHA
jgi:DNA replication and repair protein RecF